MATAQIMRPDEIVEERELDVSSSLGTLNKAEIEQQCNWALAHPRKLSEWRGDLEALVTFSPAIAKEMFYSLPRGGKQLLGPSARFAEALVSVYGNCRAGATVIGADDEYITARGVFYDCQKNVGVQIDVRRRITDSKGNRLNADMIGVTGNAAASIAFRNAAFRGIPKAAWQDLYERAMETAVGRAESFVATRDKLFDHFNRLGITDDRILNTLGIAGLADVEKEHVLALQAWTVQLQRKENTLDDIFGSKEANEIETLMAELGWNEGKKSLSRASYKGRGEEQVAYLRGQVEAHRAAQGTRAETEGVSGRTTRPAAAPKAEAQPEAAPKAAEPAKRAAKPKEEAPKPQAEAAPAAKAADSFEF